MVNGFQSGWRVVHTSNPRNNEASFVTTTVIAIRAVINSLVRETFFALHQSTTLSQPAMLYDKPCHLTGAMTSSATRVRICESSRWRPRSASTDGSLTKLYVEYNDLDDETKALLRDAVKDKSGSELKME